jgi:hypothetical protein
MAQENRLCPNCRKGTMKRRPNTTQVSFQAPLANELKVQCGKCGFEGLYSKSYKIGSEN